MITKDTKILYDLAKLVLDNPHGKRLISLLEDEYCKGQMFRDNPHELYYITGKQDLINELKYLTSLTTKDIQAMNELNDEE